TPGPLIPRRPRDNNQQSGATPGASPAQSSCRMASYGPIMPRSGDGKPRSSGGKGSPDPLGAADGHADGRVFAATPDTTLRRLWHLGAIEVPDSTRTLGEHWKRELVPCFLRVRGRICSLVGELA